MHLVLISPMLGDVLAQPYGGIFLLLLSLAALIRSK